MVYAEEGDRNMNMDEGRGGHWEEKWEYVFPHTRTSISIFWMRIC